MSPATRSYLQTLRCEGTVEQLWQALVNAEALRLWHAREARVVLEAGGLYCYDSRLLGAREATIEVMEPGRRLRLAYRPDPAWPPLGGQVIIEDFLMDTRPVGTRRAQAQLRLIGTGVPATRAWDAALRRLEAGWAVAFSYLKKRADGRELEAFVP